LLIVNCYIVFRVCGGVFMDYATTLNHGVNWQNLGAELVFTQDNLGKYLSFYWEKSANYGLKEEEIIGQSLDHIFTPVDKKAYNQRLKQVISQRLPSQFYCVFIYHNQFLGFQLIINPIIPADGLIKSVLVLGNFVGKSKANLINNSPLLLDSESLQDLLTQITRKLRRTLDLETIKLQIVDSLGVAFKVDRCLLFSYNSQKNKLKVETEYRQNNLAIKSLLGYQIDLNNELFFQEAIACKSVLTMDIIGQKNNNIKSILAVATCYQEQTLGLICLHQFEQYRSWNQGEIELIQELAEQVGTSLAHATIYQQLEQAKIEAEDASRLKSDFLASTSHELRTPLNGIIGFLKLILEEMTDDPEEQREFIQEAYNSAIHLLNLINDILDIAKIEAGKMELDLTPVILNNLLENVESFSRPQAERKNLNFQIKLPKTYQEIIIYGNYQRILQVILNLVGNAIKFTHEGGITITVEIIMKKIIRHDQEFPGIVKIAVSDTGIGVSLDQQDLLFQKFFQVKSGHTREYGGTGLGLAISQKLIETMGGKISFYSMGEGLGSTVTFTIPLHQIPVIKTLTQNQLTINN
jgi:signal transduction histidine kinase